MAVTDHGEIDGALEIAKIAPFKVIIGEEVLTPYGEIIGLFIKEKIASPCSPEEAISKIKKQGGIVVIPHPFDTLRSTALKPEILEKLIKEEVVNALEGINGRVIYASHNKAAQKHAREHQLLITAGSDSHRVDEIGNVFLEMPEFETPCEFLASLKEAGIVDRRSAVFGVRFRALWERAANRKEAKKSHYVEKKDV